MRAQVRHLVIVVAAACVAACGFGTLDEIVPHEAQQFDPLLIGSWTDSTGAESATITGDSASGYFVVYRDEDGKLGEFHAELGPLGGRRVLDLEPVDPELDRSPMYKSLLFQLHYPMLIDRVTATDLWFSGIETDSLDAFLAREPNVTPHYLMGEYTLLTARGPELRRFLDSYLRRPGVATETAKWVRKNP
jgi:hypothetical protein